MCVFFGSSKLDVFFSRLSSLFYSPLSPKKYKVLGSSLALAFLLVWSPLHLVHLHQHYTSKPPFPLDVGTNKTSAIRRKGFFFHAVCCFVILWEEIFLGELDHKLCHIHPHSLKCNTILLIERRERQTGNKRECSRKGEMIIKEYKRSGHHVKLSMQSHRRG